jgi:hypothetical protein
MRQRPRLSAMPRLLPILLLAAMDACAERIAVNAPPRMATAIITSRRVNPVARA